MPSTRTESLEESVLSLPLASRQRSFLLGNFFLLETAVTADEALALFALGPDYAGNLSGGGTGPKEGDER